MKEDKDCECVFCCLIYVVEVASALGIDVTNRCLLICLSPATGYMNPCKEF